MGTRDLTHAALSKALSEGLPLTDEQRAVLLSAVSNDEHWQRVMDAEVGRISAALAAVQSERADLLARLIGLANATAGSATISQGQGHELSKARRAIEKYQPADGDYRAANASRRAVALEVLEQAEWSAAVLSSRKKALHDGLPRDAVEAAMKLGFDAAWSARRDGALPGELDALREFHDWFLNHCEQLFAMHGMDPVDLFNKAAAARRGEA